jgi:hypothetical protein
MECIAESGLLRYFPAEGLPAEQGKDFGRHRKGGELWVALKALCKSRHQANPRIARHNACGRC